MYAALSICQDVCLPATLCAGELVRDGLPDAALFSLADMARKTLEEQRGGPAANPSRPASGDPLSLPCGVRVIYLENGRIVSDGWSNQANLLQNARLAAMRALNVKAPAKEAPVACLVEVTLPAKPLGKNGFFAAKKLDTGRQGMHITLGEKDVWLYASDFLVKGRSVSSLTEDACSSLGAKPQDVVDERLKFEVYDAAMALSLPDAPPVRLYRGGKLFDISQLDRAAVDAALTRARQWYVANRQEDGAFPYVYHPQSDEAKDDDDSQVRRLFNLAALGMLYKANKDAEIRDFGSKALDLVLKDYADDVQKPWGYIKDGENVRLGSAAAALLAIIRLDLLETKGRQAERLAAFIEGMRQEDGSYSTFFLPYGKQGSEDYYPGEAQLALMEWYAARKDAWAITGVSKSLDFYRTYFGKSMSMPMIPWHTQAYVKLHRVKPSPTLADFIFRMNDLLVSAQQRGRDIPEDCRGQIVNPQKRGGNAHVSGTGVYVEGLADALALARELGDSARIDRYRTALIWAMRNLIQFQIKDGCDTWCMPNSAKAVGGFRSTLENADIRIDNMQHCVCALLKARAVLADADYRDIAEAEARDKKQAAAK